jgi:hypothetical protein
VSVRQQPDQQTLNHVLLADDDLSYLGQKSIDKLTFFLNLLMNGFNGLVHHFRTPPSVVVRSHKSSRSYSVVYATAGPPEESACSSSREG